MLFISIVGEIVVVHFGEENLYLSVCWYTISREQLLLYIVDWSKDRLNIDRLQTTSDLPEA